MNLTDSKAFDLKHVIIAKPLHTFARHALPDSASAHSIGSRRLRIADASSVSRPGSTGTDFRLHAAYDPSRSRFTYLDISDAHGGEIFSRLPLTEGDIFLGDRAYARAPSLPKCLPLALISSSARDGMPYVGHPGWKPDRLECDLHADAGGPTHLRPTMTAPEPRLYCEGNNVKTASIGTGQVSKDRHGSA